MAGATLPPCRAGSATRSTMSQTANAPIIISCPPTPSMTGVGGMETSRCVCVWPCGWPCVWPCVWPCMWFIFHSSLSLSLFQVGRLFSYIRRTWPYWNRSASAGEARHLWYLPCDHGPGDCAFSRPLLPFKYARRNFGDRNFGDRNFGDRNFGDRNFGDRNFGERHFGERSIGGRGNVTRGDYGRNHSLIKRKVSSRTLLP